MGVVAGGTKGLGRQEGAQMKKEVSSRKEE